MPGACAPLAASESGGPAACCAALADYYCLRIAQKKAATAARCGSFSESRLERLRRWVWAWLFFCNLPSLGGPPASQLTEGHRKVYYLVPEFGNVSSTSSATAWALWSSAAAAANAFCAVDLRLLHAELKLGVTGLGVERFRLRPLARGF